MKYNECLEIVNTGLNYQLVCHGVVLCSKPTKKLALERANELCVDFGLHLKL